MTTSSEHTPDPSRRRHQWVGAVSLIALAALILPWLLTPDFQGIERSGTALRPIQDAPVILNPPRIEVPVEAPFASQERVLNEALTAPIGGELVSQVVQLGAFKERANADALASQVAALGVGRAYVRSEGSVHRVLMGPWVDQTDAEAAAARVAAALSLKPLLQRYDVRVHGPQ